MSAAQPRPASAPPPPPPAPASGEAAGRAAELATETVTQMASETPTQMASEMAAAVAGGTAAEGPDPAVVEAVAAWRTRLARAGLACKDVVLHAGQLRHCIDFAVPVPAVLQERWVLLRGQVRPGAPVSVARAGDMPQSDLLLVVPIQLPDGAAGAVGVLLAPPHSERMAEQLLLALGWLQLAFVAVQLTRSQRAGRLLDLMGHVAAQQQARAAAQEWVNRSAAWAREEAGAAAPAFGLMLFEWRGGRPHWWVAADTAWAETASPAILAAGEVAAQAGLEQQEVRVPGAWAVPVLDAGRVVAVLVARSDGAGAEPLPEAATEALRSSLALAEPLLRRWHAAERPLWRHVWDLLVEGAQRLRGPGHLAWKAGAAALALALAGLLLWPVPDRVTAQAVIEGRQRQLLTAPFEGFLGQVLVRPGDRVRQGQLLARLDDRDLRLEQARYRSERDQAAGRLRQAMAEREAAAMALALAEVQQAEAQLALVEAKLARTQLLAPVDGLVVSGDWVQQIGAPVETGKELFEIAAGSGYRVVLHVPDRDIARVRPGQPGALRLAGQPQAVYPFRVATVTATASVQETVNGFRVEADWVGAVPALSPGMQGVGKVETGRANLLTVWTRSSLDWLRLKLWTWWW